jgi:hypothetical protein
LAKQIGAKTTALTVLPPFHIFPTDTQMIEDTPGQYQARLQKHAEKIFAAASTQRKRQASHAKWSSTIVATSHPTKPTAQSARPAPSRQTNSQNCESVIPSRPNSPSSVQ